MNSSGPDRGPRVEIGRLDYGRLHCPHARALHSHSLSPQQRRRGRGRGRGRHPALRLRLTPSLSLCLEGRQRHGQDRQHRSRVSSGVSVGRVLRSPRLWGDVRRREGGTTSSSARLRASSCHCAWPHSRSCQPERRRGTPTGRAEPLFPLTGWVQAASGCNAGNDDWDWEREKPKAHVLLPMPTNGLYRPPYNSHLKGSL